MAQMDKRQGTFQDDAGALRSPLHPLSVRGVTLAMAVLSALRIWIGLKSFAMYNVATYHDEWMMFRYSDFSTHFTNTADPYALAKNMSFPLFLNLVHFSGLPYALVVSLVWVLAAWMTFRLLRRITTSATPESEPAGGNTLLPLLGFAFVLFLPSAFDALAGTKLYRNAIIGPFTLLYVLSLLFVFLGLIAPPVQHRWRSITAWAIASGLLLGFNYYISENGYWLLIPTGLLMLPAAGYVLRAFIRTRKDHPTGRGRSLVVGLLMCALPLVILAVWTVGYQAVNYRYFGVFQVNTRTGGELGRFVENVYKIASADRTETVWAPADAIDQAFRASPTLSAEPRLHKTLIEQNTWAGGANLYDSPLQGDFLTWSLPDALQQAGIWQSQSQAQRLFAQVNHELDVAFADGSLVRDDRIQISASAGGLTWGEMLGLRPLIWQGAKNSVWYSGYAHAKTLGDLKSFDTLTLDQRGLAADYMTNSMLEEGPYVGYYAGERLATDRLQKLIITAYQLVGLPLFLVACGGLGLLVVGLARRKKVTKHDRFGRVAGLKLVAMVALLLSSGVVVVGTAWFSVFLWTPSGPSSAVNPMKYYGVASVAMIALFDLLGVSVVWERLTSWRQSKAGRPESRMDHQADDN